MGSREVRIEFADPEDPAGCYSNIMNVWHTPFEFTLDFGLAGGLTETDDGHTLAVPTVARVKVPTSVIFQLARAIADNVAEYEKNYGAIQALGGPDQPPE